MQVKESTARRDELIRIQENAQASWAHQRVFEVDAPSPGMPFVLIQHIELLHEIVLKGPCIIYVQREEG